MDLFGFGTVIVHFLIISHSYHFICKGQINRKELFVFGAYTLLTEIVFDFPLYILYLDGLGIERFLFPLGLYSYFRWMKQYERDRGLFLSLLLSLLYESTHNFLSVTFSSITGDNFVLQYHFPFFFVVTVLTYFVTLKIIYYFHLELAYFDEDYLYPFLKKVFFALLLLHIVSFVSDMVSTIKHLNSFGSILSSIVFISLLLTFFAMNSHKVQMEKEIALKQKKFEQKHLQNYTDEIVGLYNEIRGFRHDYAGMLVSMQMAIDSGNLQEIDRIYNEVLVKANHKLRSDKYTYFDLNNIEDSALRSLVAQSIVALVQDLQGSLENLQNQSSNLSTLKNQSNQVSPITSTSLIGLSSGLTEIQGDVTSKLVPASQSIASGVNAYTTGVDKVSQDVIQRAVGLG